MLKYLFKLINHILNLFVNILTIILLYMGFYGRNGVLLKFLVVFLRLSYDYRGQYLDIGPNKIIIYISFMIISFNSTFQVEYRRPVRDISLSLCYTQYSPSFHNRTDIPLRMVSLRHISVCAPLSGAPWFCGVV
jgi:hypothetical protein